ncbi:MAG TPA: nuclear transport factor 2 family protein [Chloroflexota bacterium]|jgi:hypothetical protein|nr:nuclear transport factor 2 family protein [Chloroflexota bacterium]
MTLQELSDREEMREVLVRYAQSLDRRQFDELRRVFTPDAQATYGANTVDPGVDNIIDYVGGVANLVATTHFVGETSFRIDGDQAETENYAVAYLVDAEKVRVRGLRYRDHWVRTPDGWRIHKRVHTPDWMFLADSVSPRISA